MPEREAAREKAIRVVQEAADEPIAAPPILNASDLNARPRQPSAEENPEALAADPAQAPEKRRGFAKPPCDGFSRALGIVTAAEQHPAANAKTAVAAS